MAVLALLGCVRKTGSLHTSKPKRGDMYVINMGVTQLETSDLIFVVILIGLIKTSMLQ